MYVLEHVCAKLHLLAEEFRGRANGPNLVCDPGQFRWTLWPPEAPSAVSLVAEKTKNNMYTNVSKMPTGFVVVESQRTVVSRIDDENDQIVIMTMITLPFVTTDL